MKWLRWINLAAAWLRQRLDRKPRVLGLGLGLALSMAVASCTLRSARKICLILCRLARQHAKTSTCTSAILLNSTRGPELSLTGSVKTKEACSRLRSEKSGQSQTKEDST
jgi:hypothetical protein